MRTLHVNRFGELIEGGPRYEVKPFQTGEIALTNWLIRVYQRIDKYSVPHVCITPIDPTRNNEEYALDGEVYLEHKDVIELINALNALADNL